MKIGFDIGGSKTKLIVFDGEWHSYTVVGSFGTAEDSGEIISALRDGILSLGISGKPEKIIVNLGGKNKEQIKNTILSVFPNTEIEIYRESEGTIALAMMRAYGANVVVMAGTGTIAFGEGGGKRCVLDGWGKEIGDRGSGYALGMAAIQKTLMELDSDEKELSAIAKYISKRNTPFDFNEISDYTASRDAVRANLPKTRGEIAALTKEVVRLANEGCEVSLELVKSVGAELWQTIAMVARKIGASDVSVVINGGMTASASLWESRLKELEGGDISLSALYVTNEGIENALKYMLGAEK